MCFLIACCGWTIDLIQRFWTFVMSCFICWIVCSLLVVTTMAGVALGYNYSLAEYIDMKEGKNITVYLKRGIFASDYINYGLKGLKYGAHTSTSFRPTTTIEKSVTENDIATSQSERRANLVQLEKTVAVTDPTMSPSGKNEDLAQFLTTFPFEQISQTSGLRSPSKSVNNVKRTNVSTNSIYKDKYEATTPMNSITEDNEEDIEPTNSNIGTVPYTFIPPDIGINYYVFTRSMPHNTEKDPFVKHPVPYFFYKKLTTGDISHNTGDIKPDIQKIPNLLYALKANNDDTRRMMTQNRDEEYEYDIQGLPARKKRTMLLNKITSNQEYNKTEPTVKINIDLRSWKTTSEPTALQKNLEMKEHFTSEEEQTINLNTLHNHNYNIQHKNAKPMAIKTSQRVLYKIMHSTLKYVRPKISSYSSGPIQRSHSKFLNILRNFNNDIK